MQQEIKEIKDRRKRLQAALEAHLDALLDGSNYVQVVIRVLPRDTPKVKLIVGGSVPDVVERGLLDIGVDQDFHPGSSLDEITEPVAALTRESRHRTADSGDPL